MIVSIAIPESTDDARWLVENRRNFQIPNAIITRLEQAADPSLAGIEIAAELVRELTTLPGASGVHLMATRNLAAIPAVIERAGLDRTAE